MQMAFSKSEWHRDDIVGAVFEFARQVRLLKNPPPPIWQLFEAAILHKDRQVAIRSGPIMTRKRYRCVSCQGVFEYDHHPSIEADPLPTDEPCPHCGVLDFGSEPAVVAPHIAARSIVKVVDNMHRDIEDGEKFRANVAMERFGLDADEARAMVATNSLDSLRAGDTSAIPVNNQVTQAMAAAPQSYGFSPTAAQQGLAASPQVQSGLFPNAGLRALTQLRAIHPAMVASSGHNTVATSSLPALETQAPGYRPRM